MNDRHGLLTAPIGRVLLNMTLPNLIGIFTVLGFSLVDTFFISQLGTDALAAISFTFPITLLISSVAIGIGAGVSTNLGRLFGSGNAPKAKVFLHDSLLLTFFLTFSLTVVGNIFLVPIFTLLGAEQVHLPLIKDYMNLWLLGAPILVLLMIGNQGLRATGDTRSPALIMALAALVNLVLDPLLIFGIGPFPRLALQGAAISSVVSWIIAILLAGHLLIIKRNLVEFADVHWERLTCNWRQLAHIARPAALMNLLNPLANALIMALLARLDVTAVAAFGAGVRLESVLLIVVMALSSSLVPFIAQNLGAGQQARAHRALMLSLKFVLLFQTLLYLPLVYFAQPLAELFSQDPRVLEWLSFYIVALPAAYGPLGIVILVATSFNAYHRPLSSLTINVCRLFAVMLPMVLIGAYLEGVKGVLLALPIANIAMGACCYLLAMKISEPNQQQKMAS